MTTSDDVSYGDSSVWDSRFKREGDLDWGGFWTDPFLDTLVESNLQQGSGSRMWVGKRRTSSCRFGLPSHGSGFFENSAGHRRFEAEPESRLCEG